MWYFVLYALCAIWVLVDARSRRNNIIGWPLATFFLGPIFLPIYGARRHLKQGEIREGGTGWNIMKNFALLWTLTMFVAGIVGMVGAGEVVQQATSEAEQAGAAIGATLGVGMLIGLWFIGVLGALVLGLLLKKTTVVEKGPTGPLAGGAPQQQ